jgi:membrane associated rhomboid family serine protease
MVAAFRFAGFLQVPAGRAYTGGVKQIGQCWHGEGWGYLGLRAAQKATEARQGVLSTLPLTFLIDPAALCARLRAQTSKARSRASFQTLCHCALAQAAETRLSQPCRLGTLLKVRFVLELPQHPTQDDPPRAPAEMPPNTPSEPILTLPPALTAYVLLISLIHLRVLLPVEWEEWTIDVFGFIPKRYDTTLLDVTFPGGAGARVWSFVTYSLLHANLSHIGFNVLWLLPFGSALARRFGPFRFYLFMAVTAAAGALAHLVTHEHALAPMIGASASVSGTMAAAMRFAFVRGSFLSFSRGDAEAAAKVPALSLWRALRNGRVLAFLAIWFGVNIIFGVGSIAVGMDEGQSVAWQAHIGGFVAGLILFALFDPVPRGESDAATALRDPPR